MRRRSGAVLALLVLALTSGGDDGGGGSGSTASGPEGEIEETILTWLLEGDCDTMTDQFLEDQVLAVGDSRQENCELFQDFFIEKQYEADDVKITDIEITGSEATAVVGDDFSGIESTYTLVKEGGRWRIDSAELD